ncbi:MAG: DUF4339 domain-containing protein [Verrucomicrobiaceae bacterium]
MNTSPNSLWFYSEAGEQKGPVPFSQLQQLIAQGLPPSSLVWTEGLPEWIAATTIPQLVPSSAQPGNNPYAAPSTDVSLPNATHLSTDGGPPEHPVPLDVTFCIGQAWKHTFANFGTIILTGLVYGAVVFGVGMVMGLIAGGGSGFQVTEEGFRTQSNNALSWVGEIVNQCVSIFLSLGATHIGLRILRGEKPEIGELFSQGPKFLQGALATILYFLMVVGGLILLIVPGIYLALRFGFYREAIVEKNLDAISALKYSSQLTRDNRLSLFGLWLLGFLITIAGALALLVGLIVAIPVVWLSTLVAYRYLHAGPNGLKVLP